MSLVGFKARNHPQQVNKVDADEERRARIDDRQTAPEVFAPINDRFGFTLDVAALPHNTKCERFFTPGDDGLAKFWMGERVWCNPPFSSIEPWLVKAWQEWELHRASGDLFGPECIVMILPNRTEQGFWQRHVEPHLRARRDDFRVEFLSGRTRFIAHDDTEVQPDARPPYACCLLIWHDAPVPVGGEVPTGAVGRKTPAEDRNGTEQSEGESGPKPLNLTTQTDALASPGTSSESEGR